MVLFFIGNLVYLLQQTKKKLFIFFYERRQLKQNKYVFALRIGPTFCILMKLEKVNFNKSFAIMVSNPLKRK